MSSNGVHIRPIQHVQVKRRIPQGLLGQFSTFKYILEVDNVLYILSFGMKLKHRHIGAKNGTFLAKKSVVISSKTCAL